MWPHWAWEDKRVRDKHCPGKLVRSAQWLAVQASEPRPVNNNLGCRGGCLLETWAPTSEWGRALSKRMGRKAWLGWVRVGRQPSCSTTRGACSPLQPLHTAPAAFTSNITRCITLFPLCPVPTLKSLISKGTWFVYFLMNACIDFLVLRISINHYHLLCYDPI